MADDTAQTDSTPDYSDLVGQSIWQSAGSSAMQQLANQLQDQVLATNPVPNLPVIQPTSIPAVFGATLAPRAGGAAPAHNGGGFNALAGGTYHGGGQGEALLRDAAYKAGFRGQALETAVAVGMAESGGDPRNLNNNARTGDLSYGLWQINMLGGMGPERRAQYGLQSNDQLFDPYVNARIAYQMSGGGKNWGPWSTYKGGQYRRYMDPSLVNYAGG